MSWHSLGAHWWEVPARSLSPVVVLDEDPARGCTQPLLKSPGEQLLPLAALLGNGAWVPTVGPSALSSCLQVVHFLFLLSPQTIETLFWFWEKASSKLSPHHSIVTLTLLLARPAPGLWTPGCSLTGPLTLVPQGLCILHHLLQGHPSFLKSMWLKARSPACEGLFDHPRWKCSSPHPLPPDPDCPYSALFIFMAIITTWHWMDFFISCLLIRI